MFYNPTATNDPYTLYSSASDSYADAAAAHNGFANTTSYHPDSPFNTLVPQGAGVHQRIGSKIQVVKDKWRFKVEVPPYAGKGSYYFPNFRLSHRMMKVRLVGIFQDKLVDAGDAGFTPTQLFRSVKDIDTLYNTQNARGFRIVYDKTKKVFPRVCQEVQAPEGTQKQASAGFTSNGEAYFSVSLKYMKQWVDTNTSGSEIPTSIDYTNPAGLLRGIVTWYIYCEDLNAPVYFDGGTTPADALTDTAAGTPINPNSSWPSNDPRRYCWTGINLYVTRRFYYTDA